MKNDICGELQIADISNLPWNTMLCFYTSFPPVKLAYCHKYTCMNVKKLIKTDLLRNLRNFILRFNISYIIIMIILYIKISYMRYT